MKKHSLSKFIALAVAGTLLVSPLTAFGADPSSNEEGTSVSTNGTGSSVGTVDKEIYKVVLPTDSGSTFEYVVDPQDLLNQSADVTSTVSGNLLYFKSSSNADFNDTSADLTVVNKSSVPVDVTVSASTDVAAEDPEVALAEDATFKGAPAQSIYLALSVSANGAVDKKALAAGKETTITKTLADASAYYSVGGDVGSFTYVLDDQNTNTYDELSFNLSGACNAGDEWDEDATLPTISLVWGFEKGEDAVTDGPLSVTHGGLITITMDSCAAVGLSFSGESNPSKKYNISQSQGTMDLSDYHAGAAGTYKFQFSDSLLDAWRGGEAITVYATYGGNSYSVTINF